MTLKIAWRTLSEVGRTLKSGGAVIGRPPNRPEVMRMMVDSLTPPEHPIAYKRLFRETHDPARGAEVRFLGGRSGTKLR